MKTSITLCLVLVVVSALNCLVDSIEFCESFRGNNHEISYIFRREFKERPYDPIQFDIIINGQYWRLHFEAGFKQLTFADPERQSKPCPFFGGQYLMAGCAKVHSKFCQAVVFEKTNWKNMIWANITNDNSDEEKDLSEYKQSDTSVLPDDPPKMEPIFAFHRNYSDLWTHLVLVEKSVTNFVPHTYKVFLDKEDKSFSIALNKEDITFGALKQYNTSYQMIGIIHLNDPARKWSADSRILILLKDNHRIRYIDCRSEVLDDFCKNESNTKVLIDCSLPPTKTSNKFYIILFAVVGVIVIFALIIGTIVLFYKRNKKNMKNSPSIKKKISSTGEDTKKTSSTVEDKKKTSSTVEDKKKTSSTVEDKKKTTPTVEDKKMKIGPQIRTKATTTSGTGPTSAMKKPVSPKK